jgi:hypothetical protein
MAGIEMEVVNPETEMQPYVGMRVRTLQNPIREGTVRYTHKNGIWVQFDERGQTKFYDYYEWDVQLEKMIDDTVIEWLNSL